MAEALDLGLLKGARLLAGARGLNGLILHVSYSDAPDSADFMQGNELVLSTGFGVRENPETLRDFIENHHRNGTVALAIKPKRFLGAIPQSVLDYADEVGHPILDIPPELPWIDIINPLLTEILNRQAASMKRVLQAHQELARMVLGGTGLKGIAQRLATMVGHPVAIFNHMAQPMAIGLPDNLDAMPDGLEAAIQRGLFTDSPGTAANGTSFPQRAYPVMVDQVRYGYLCVYPLERPFRETDQVYLEHGTVLLALEMLKERAVAEVEQRHRWQFLDQILAGWYPSQEALITRARELGFDFTRGHKVVVLCLAGTAARNPAQSRRIRLGLFEAVQMRLRSHGAIAVDRGEELVVLLPVHDAPNRNAKTYTLQVMADVLAQVASLQEPHGMYLCAGVGRYRPDPAKLDRSFREARQAALVLRTAGGGKRLVHVDDLGVYRLLYSLSQAASAHLSTYYSDLLGSLLTYDQGRSSELLQTLEVYLRVASVREAGKFLNIHPNTVKYRLRRIQELTGADLADFETRVGLYVAIAAMHVMETI